MEEKEAKEVKMYVVYQRQELLFLAEMTKDENGKDKPKFTTDFTKALFFYGPKPADRTAKAVREYMNENKIRYADVVSGVVCVKEIVIEEKKKEKEKKK